MEKSGLIVLFLFATLSAVTAGYCSYESGCDYCCNGYCCSKDSNGLGTGYMVLIVGSFVVVAVLFWVCTWYLRRRTVIATGPPAGANTSVVNTSHVVSPVNPNHAGYNQQGQHQQWFQPMTQFQPQATPSNSQAPPPYSSVEQQGANQKDIPV